MYEIYYFKANGVKIYVLAFVTAYPRKSFDNIIVAKN